MTRKIDRSYLTESPRNKWWHCIKNMKSFARSQKDAQVRYQCRTRVKTQQSKQLT